MKQFTINQNSLKNTSIVFLLLFFTSISFVTFSQDLIVLNNSDSINSKILTQSKKVLSYLYVKNGDVKKNTIYVPSRIDDVKKGFYKSSEIPVDNAFEEKNPQIIFSIGSGYSRLFRNQTGDAMMDQVNNGFYIDSELLINYKKKYGFGIKFNYFRSKGYGYTLLINDSYTGYVLDEMIVQLAFLGLPFKITSPLSERSNMVFSIIPGTTIANKSFSGKNTHNMTYGGFGFEAGVGYHIFPNKKANLAINLSGIIILSEDLYSTSRFNIGVSLNIK